MWQGTINGHTHKILIPGKGMILGAQVEEQEEV